MIIDDFNGNPPNNIKPTNTEKLKILARRLKLESLSIPTEDLPDEDTKFFEIFLEKADKAINIIEEYQTKQNEAGASSDSSDSEDESSVDPEVFNNFHQHIEDARNALQKMNAQPWKSLGCAILSVVTAAASIAFPMIAAGTLAYSLSATAGSLSLLATAKSILYYNGFFCKPQYKGIDQLNKTLNEAIPSAFRY